MQKKETFEFTFAQPETLRERRKGGELPMRILVLADLTGRRNRGIESAGDLGSRAVVKVDVDDFEQTLYRFAPRLDLSLAGAAAAVTFRELDDFHPDALYRGVAVFQALRSSRDRLLDPETLAVEAARLSAPATEPASTEDDRDTLARLLGKPSAAGAGAQPTSPRLGGTDIDLLIRNVVAPHIVPRSDPRQAELVTSVERAIGEQMRRLLHEPSFRALEATWRSIHQLVVNLDLDENLEVRLVDISKAELARGLRRGETATSDLYRLLAPQEAACIVGDYVFSGTAEDLELLEAVGELGGRLGAPFLAGAAPELLGCESLHAAPDPSQWAPAPELDGRWTRFRAGAAARWVGLALPRLLLRLPYGKRLDEIESFEFEELSPDRDHEEFHWGNPSFGCARLLALAFIENGWEMEPGDCLQLEDLPALGFLGRDDAPAPTCAEVLLSERGADAVLDRGLMPFACVRGTNDVRLARFQSAADPLQPLQGPWNPS